MLGNNNQQDPNTMSAGEKHVAVMQELDEIKRYVAGIFSKVDTEIDEMRKMLDSISREVREHDQQIDKIEQVDRTLRNVENQLKDMSRKIR